MFYGDKASWLKYNKLINQENPGVWNFFLANISTSRADCYIWNTNNITDITIIKSYTLVSMLENFCLIDHMYCIYWLDNSNQ